MGIVIGIDVGGSTTKIVGVEDKKIKNPMFVKATDPVTSFIQGPSVSIFMIITSLSEYRESDLDGCR